MNAALEKRRLKFYDVLLVDTAGRLHVDEAMMDKIKQVHASINPVETPCLWLDAMTGQDAANTAKAFNEALPLTGVVLTKVDGDASRRCGAFYSSYHRCRSNSSVWAKPKRWSRSTDRIASRISVAVGRRTVADWKISRAKLTVRRPRSCQQA